MKTLIEISKSGLAAAQRSLSVTSNNIVNANTPGYTRQRVDATPIGMQQGNRSVGLGVNISTATRLRNDMNDIQTNQKQQDLSFMEYKTSVFERLQAAMTTDGGGDLDTRISKVFDMFSELASNPQDMSVRNSLMSEVQQMTTKFRNIDESLSDTSELILTSSATTIENINSLLKDIDQLNAAVAKSMVNGEADATSMDLRVRKLEELSGLVNFERSPRPTGEIDIQIAGVSVLSPTGPETLTYEVNESENYFAIRLGNGKLVDATSGEIGAQIEMYKETIPDLKAKIDSIAQTMVEQINSIHSGGFGLIDGTARNFFDPSNTTAATISVNSFLINNPEHVAASDTVSESGNGGVASLIADVRDATLFGGRKIVDYTISVISEPGAELFNLSSMIETREAEIAMLKTQQERQAGVNIDEELSMMIQYQNAYQGSAKVMSAAQDMYDTLLGLIR